MLLTVTDVISFNPSSPPVTWGLYPFYRSSSRLRETVTGRRCLATVRSAGTQSQLNTGSRPCVPTASWGSLCVSLEKSMCEHLSSYNAEGEQTHRLGREPASVWVPVPLLTGWVSRGKFPNVSVPQSEDGVLRVTPSTQLDPVRRSGLWLAGGLTLRGCYFMVSIAVENARAGRGARESVGLGQ